MPGIPVPTQPPLINNAPSVFAGDDHTIWLPVTHVDLKGEAKDPENNIQTTVWKQISGDALAAIDQSGNLNTRVSFPQTGRYQFELTVTDAAGLVGKDSILITLKDLPGSELVFDDLGWVTPWYHVVEVKDFLAQLPPNTDFEVFIKRDSLNIWKQVPPLKIDSQTIPEYEYHLEKRLEGAGIYNFGSLYVFYYGDNINDTPSVKITF
mgnify:FL=1